MNLRYARSSPNLMLFLLVVFTSELHGCKLVEKTYDGCGDRRIWLGGTINTNTYKGQTNTYGISRSIREMDWYCGYGGRERVAWRGEANRLIVSFSGNSRRITWQFYKCDPPPGCQAEKPPQETKDNCVGGGHLWLASGIEKSIPKGSSDDSIEISRGMRELQWYCGYLSAERVAWGGNANRIRVNFDWNGRISWEFFTCNPPAECRYNHHSSSLNIKVKKLHLTSAPTDKVAFGWESLFGKPADEIVVNLESKNCYKKSRTREIKQGQTLYYNYPPVFLNSFRDEPIKFWLSEEDSGFEGKNDLSEVVTISAEKKILKS